jgi:Family of unknown function (DUF6064)
MRSFPFTAEIYFSLFDTYNGAIWPAQLVAYGLGILALGLALRPVAAGGRLALAVLSVFWLWNGVAYHLLHFFQINFAALGFGALFVLQGLLFAGGAIGGHRAFRFRRDVFGWNGLTACLFALVAYPLLGWLAGHGWPRAGMFGVAPAPTTIFTFGMLLMLEGGAPFYLFVIPLLWSLAGGLAAVFILRIPEDMALLVAGIAGTGMLVWKRRQARASGAAQRPAP